MQGGMCRLQVQRDGCMEMGAGWEVQRAGCTIHLLVKGLLHHGQDGLEVSLLVWGELEPLLGTLGARW